MAIFVDQNGVSCFVDQNGISEFVDQNGNLLTCGAGPPPIPGGESKNIFRARQFQSQGRKQVYG